MTSHDHSNRLPSAQALPDRVIIVILTLIENLDFGDEKGIPRISPKDRIGLRTWFYGLRALAADSMSNNIDTPLPCCPMSIPHQLCLYVISASSYPWFAREGRKDAFP
jgi:hypothetical protein